VPQSAAAAGWAKAKPEAASAARALSRLVPVIANLQWRGAVLRDDQSAGSPVRRLQSNNNE
jgi:hypothetical protein